ncbi:MAG: hypothetical protein GY869_09020 [Planctomycetes bacterium]|nr:hypothetical protein [Planctomycetota bacterium]
MENKPETKTIGAVGCLIGFIALTLAFLSPWIADMIDPPTQSTEEKIVDFAQRLKDAAAAKASGEEYQSEPQEKSPSAYLPPFVIALGLIGTGCGVTSFLKNENKKFSTTAIALGISAAVVQWSIIFVAIFLVIFIIAFILNALGIDLPI